MDVEDCGGKPRIASQSDLCLQSRPGQTSAPDICDGPGFFGPLLGPKLQPEILFGSPSCLVLYKPPLMHSVPLVPGEKGTLLDFAAKSHPEVLEVRGRKACEGGFLHRLDYHTSGLLLAARTQKAFDDLSCQQENGLLVKEYLAAARAGSPPAGFPPFPGLVRRLGRAFIESSFRHWGPGRRAVRPSSFPGIFYRTEILSSRQEADGNLLFHLLLVRGYRHQIRCHLAWAGSPILNDPLYGGLGEAGGFLALCAVKIAFTDPETGDRCEYGMSFS